MAVVESNPLADLLRDAVEEFPLAKRLGLILPEKIAQTVGCCRRTLDREIERGRIRVTRVAGRTYIPKSAALAWWEQSQKRRRPCRTTRTSDTDSKARSQRRKHRGAAQSCARTMPGQKAAR